MAEKAFRHKHLGQFPLEPIPKLVKAEIDNAEKRT